MSNRTETQTAPRDREDTELENLRERLTAGLKQARRGDLTEGSGEAAIRRAFAAVRSQI